MTLPAPNPPAASKKFGLQDALLMLGLVLFIGGIGHFSRAIAAIAAGLLCFLGVWTIERASKRGKA